MNLIGFRKQWRKIWSNPIFIGNPNRICVWMWLLDHAMWKDGVKVRFAKQTIELKRGQLTCGAYQIAKETGVARATVERVIKLLINEEQIELRTDRQCSLITVKNWELYQLKDEVNEERVRNERGTSEERVRTKEEDKNSKNEKNTYVGRVETETVYETIKELCDKYGLENAVNKKALDVYTSRYVGKIHMKVEAQHCIAWLVDHKMRTVSTQRIGNWFKKAQEIQKREQLKQLERKEKMNEDPSLRAKRKESFKIHPDVKKRIEEIPGKKPYELPF